MGKVVRIAQKRREVDAGFLRLGKAGASALERRLIAQCERILQQRVRSGVVHAHARADYGRKHGVGPHATGGRKSHIDRKGQTVLVWNKRAQVVGKTLGQHREHAVGKVDGRGASARLKVDRAFPRHVMRDIGDMDAQVPATIRRARNGDGVVEIARVNGVDGDKEAIADVATQRVCKSSLDIQV